MESNFYLICFKKVKLLWKKGFKNRAKIITIMYFCILQISLQKIKNQDLQKK